MSAAQGSEAPGTPDRWEPSYRAYDLVKEFVIALVVVSLLTIGLTVLFSSPDVQPVTFRSWSQADPSDFVATALSELNGTSEASQYGPPYTHTPGAAQKVGPVDLQSIPGVRIPIDTAQDFVVGPLRSEAGDDPTLRSAIARYTAAPERQQGAWTSAYQKALGQATIRDGLIHLPSGTFGPVSTLMQAELSLAQSGGLDGAMVATRQFYETDYTKPVLFLSGGSYFEDRASAQNLLGEQWGMMNETGQYPGQAWLWLYTFWYQISPFKNSGNADAEIWVIMVVLTLALVVVPFVPGVRSIPRLIPVYRLIWRDYYRQVEGRNRR